MKPATRHCAIYTRKSSEEGLDMEFNSLDAQREACAAYIASQKAEGWQPIKTHYDDGGFSGGNLGRPGLKQLLADIESGKVHIIVVYKIDRLTRSLMDFAKLVETFDKHGVTFVSVTQSFNTTTSMGRLTLNVLLSFAQFEREVTSERIRDKIAASKKKGMWMGGVAPIGYKSEDRKLLPDLDHVSTVRHIFKRYLHWGSVTKLKDELDRDKIFTRTWVSQKGTVHEQASFSRGILYKILKNPVYIGQITHKDQVYEGQHDAIIDRLLWDQVQMKLADHAAQPRGQKKISETDLLKGILFDLESNSYSPSYSIKDGKRYRYYISQALLQYRDHPKGIIARLPAQELENLICDSLRNLLNGNTLNEIFGLEDDASIRHITDGQDLRQTEKLLISIVSRVVIRDGGVSIKIDTAALRNWLSLTYSVGLPELIKPAHIIDVPFVTGRAKTGTLILAPVDKARNTHDPFDRPEAEIRAWVQGIIWRDEHFRGRAIRQIANREGVSTTHILKYINKTFKVA